MKFLPPPPKAPKTDSMVGRGMDIALTVALFVAVGIGLDRWLGTLPWFTIGLTVLAGIGFFAKFKYQYDAAMEQHEAERLERTGARRSGDRDD
jgi:F0F1-type ATP synthase assembly protein I